MNNEALVLALFASRAATEGKDAPLTRWDTWEIVESEYPGLAGASRSTIYRVVARLEKQGALRHVGREPGRSQDRQLLAITPKGQKRLKEEVSKTDVEVNDLRRPGMTLATFMDFIVLATYVGDGLVESALERRIRSLKDTLDRGLKEVGGGELDVLTDALVHQARIELSSLEHFLTCHRRESRARG